QSSHCSNGPSSEVALPTLFHSRLISARSSDGSSLCMIGPSIDSPRSIFCSNSSKLSSIGVSHYGLLVNGSCCDWVTTNHLSTFCAFHCAMIFSYFAMSFWMYLMVLSIHFTHSSIHSASLASACSLDVQQHSFARRWGNDGCGFRSM